MKCVVLCRGNLRLKHIQQNELVIHFSITVIKLKLLTEITNCIWSITYSHTKSSGGESHSLGSPHRLQCKKGHELVLHRQTIFLCFLSMVVESGYLTIDILC